MRYHISFNVPSRVILGLLGSGPRQSWVDIRPDEVHARMGWLGEFTIPRAGLGQHRLDHAVRHVADHAVIAVDHGDVGHGIPSSLVRS